MSIGPGMACASCQTYYAARQNGVYVLETMDDGTPYKVWQADLYECPSCGHQLVAGYAGQALAVKHEDNFNFYLEQVDVTINGCPKRLA